MIRLDVHDALDAAGRQATLALLQAAQEVEGRTTTHPLADALAADQPAGTAIVVATDEGARTVSESAVAVARITPTNRPHHPGPRWTVEAVVHPAHRHATSSAGTSLAAAVRSTVVGRGGGLTQMWASQPRPDQTRFTAALGLAPGRVLYQMRCPLPVDPAIVGDALPLPTRPFRPGDDEDAWLEVNNRAFSWHPEQGGWDRVVLADHERQDWFDPMGFLLLEEGDRLAGFCWTQIHPATSDDPALGEIYVIATDPDFSGRGLGRRLTLAGLDYMAGRGVADGMLYVDALNVRAVKLYADLGFVVHHVDQVFLGPIG